MNSGASGAEVNPSAVDKEILFKMAQQEMEHRAEMFNKMTSSCFNKCIGSSFKESDLNMSENGCIDKCTAKYWQVQSIIAQLLNG